MKVVIPSSRMTPVSLRSLSARLAVSSVTLSRAAISFAVGAAAPASAASSIILKIACRLSSASDGPLLGRSDNGTYPRDHRVDLPLTVNLRALPAVSTEISPAFFRRMTPSAEPVSRPTAAAIWSFVGDCSPASAAASMNRRMSSITDTTCTPARRSTERPWPELQAAAASTAAAAASRT